MPTGFGPETMPNSLVVDATSFPSRYNLSVVPSYVPAI